MANYLIIKTFEIPLGLEPRLIDSVYYSLKNGNQQGIKYSIGNNEQRAESAVDPKKRPVENIAVLVEAMKESGMDMPDVADEVITASTTRIDHGTVIYPLDAAELAVFHYLCSKEKK